MQREALAGPVRSENRKHRTGAYLQVEARATNVRDPTQTSIAAAFEQRRPRFSIGFASCFSEHAAASEFPMR